MFGHIYRNKRVLVTGHTGFKGSWLTQWLLMLGADVAGYAKNIPTQPAHFSILNLHKHIRHHEGDVRDYDALKHVFDTFKPEIVMHLAAQSLVRLSYDQPLNTFETNVLGTINVIECIRNSCDVEAAVIITSDKCYENVEWTWGYRENDRLGGSDPYSASKACAEIAVSAYLRSFFASGGARIATTRAGNVIGGGDWAENRVVPDAVRAWSQQRVLEIRRPNATRPWQHVLEPLSGYLWLGAALMRGKDGTHGEAFNFGPKNETQSVRCLVDALSAQWKNGDARYAVTEDAGAPEAGLLKLSCDKALHTLNWNATLDFHQTVAFTSDWYNAFYSKKDFEISELSLRQIAQYTELARLAGLAWSPDESRH